MPLWASAAFAASVLAACAAPPPPPPRPVAEATDTRLEAGTFGADPGVAYVRAREEERRGIGVPPALPAPDAVNRLPGALRALRPAPGTGPSGPPPLPVPGNALSRMSALPASPLANPPGFAMGRR